MVCRVCIYNMATFLFGRAYSGCHELCILAFLMYLVGLRRAEISSLLSVQKAQMSSRPIRGRKGKYLQDFDENF